MENIINSLKEKFKAFTNNDTDTEFEEDKSFIKYFDLNEQSKKEHITQEDKKLLNLISELEDEIYDSKRIPLTSTRLINEDLILDIIDDIKLELNTSNTINTNIKDNEEINKAVAISNEIKKRGKRYVSELLDEAEVVIEKTLAQIKENKKELE